MGFLEFFVPAFKGIGVIFGILFLCLYTVLAERKISAWVQGRRGPNRTTLPVVGSIPVIGRCITRMGMFQPMADGGKLLFKEDLIPGHVNRFYFVIAPILAFIPALIAVSVVPFGQYISATTGTVRTLILTDIDVGILLVFAIASFGVYSLILAGWSSNSKYPLLGGIRAAAQMISYEMAMVVSVIPVFLWVNGPGGAGTLSLVRVVEVQENFWFAIWQPMSALIFIIAIFAETNRLPFDMPESETDLVGGYHTEYASFKFGLFFVGEYANMLIGSCLVVLLFFGGWHPLPWITWNEVAEWTNLPFWFSGIPGALVSLITFMAKTFLMLFLFILVRWTLPRFRYDQVMRIGWKVLLPASIGNLVFNAVLIAMIDRFWN
ncbi:MAG: complex I subunit 1 family protein [Opitutaceae bacterium]